MDNNQSLSPLTVTDLVLRSRQAHEAEFIREVVTENARRTALVPWHPAPPVGQAALHTLTVNET